MEDSKTFHFIKELRGRDDVKGTIDSLEKAIHEIHMLMLSIQDTQPEYYNKLVEVRMQMIRLQGDLKHHFDGFIMYA
jgi:hypothetical protein